MAKILLISENINSTTWQLALSLKAQQHQIYFLTSYGETVEDSQGIEILSYFKKWSAFEASKLMPTLLSLRPQIVHFILETDRIAPAHLILWSFTQAQNSIVFTLSLMHIEKGLSHRNWVRYLIQHSDIVTCPSIDALAHLRGIEVKSPRQGRSLLPPSLSVYRQENLEDLTEFDTLLEDQSFLIRPFNQPYFDPKSSYFQSLLTALESFKVVLFGSYSHWKPRERKRFQSWLEGHGLESKWFITGFKHLSQISSLMQKSEALWLADLDLTPVELTAYYLKALETSATLLLDPKQARLHAPLWQNGHNSWIISPNSYDAFFKQEHLKLDYESQEMSLDRKDLVDAPLNELNRLYNKALSLKASL